MNEFQYQVSVIVPVYNVEEYLSACLDSLMHQTIEFSSIEVLVVDDGSTDNSLSICQKYAERYPNIKVFTKPNEGLSATRNYAICRATGKYIMYLDSDDSFTHTTIKQVTDFFDEHYDEVDLVTYKIVPYTDGKARPLHYRYKTLQKSGIYDLRNPENAFITQTNVNICVKNLFEDNIYFDTTPGFRHEDQKYCLDVLSDKMKIGYCSHGEYRYVYNPSSITKTYFYAYYLFEPTMAYWEQVFRRFSPDIPAYVMGMYMNDLNWKLKDDILFPYHYEPEAYQKAIGRIQALLSLVDADIILNHPAIDKFHKFYWLNMKPNIHPAVVADGEAVRIFADGKQIYFRRKMEIVLHKIRIKNKQLRLLAFLKSPVYNYLDTIPNIYVMENGNRRVKMEPFRSVHSFYRSGTQTNRFFAFSYECDTREVQQFSIGVELQGHEFDTTFYRMPISGFTRGRKAYVRDHVEISLKNNVFTLRQLSPPQADRLERAENLKVFRHPRAYTLRQSSLQYRRKHRIWLYYDLYTVEKDNGYYQFIDDFKHQDGIERYYVMNRDYENLDTLFTPEQQQCLVRFGSLKHKLLYLSSERIFTAFYGLSPISPFAGEGEEQIYYDIEKFETIYLQHGVLHAGLYLNNSVERCRAEQIVISSPFEKENYMKNYGYEERDLIPTGMARYDHIDRNHAPANKILFAPSWRKYLTTQHTASQWSLVKSKLQQSDYFKKFSAFLESERLEQLLEQYDMELEVKLHPIIANADDMFQIRSNRIRMAEKNVVLEDYKVFITDFSSFVFDFAYLNRPIFYFVPDYEQFKSGMNHYRVLDLPFEKAFGHLVLEPEDALGELSQILAAGCIPETVFRERMEQFFYPLDQCAEALYQYVMKQDQVEE